MERLCPSQIVSTPFTDCCNEYFIGFLDRISSDFIFVGRNKAIWNVLYLVYIVLCFTRFYLYMALYEYRRKLDCFWSIATLHN